METTLTTEEQAIAEIPASCRCTYERRGGHWVRTVPKPGCGWHHWETPDTPGQA